MSGIYPKPNHVQTSEWFFRLKHTPFYCIKQWLATCLRYKLPPLFYSWLRCLLWISLTVFIVNILNRIFLISCYVQCRFFMLAGQFEIWTWPYMHSTGCNRIRYTTLKIYCDQTNSNITTQFLTEHLFPLNFFYECSIWLPLVVGTLVKKLSGNKCSVRKCVVILLLVWSQ
jgi:hypothetical protein